MARSPGDALKRAFPEIIRLPAALAEAEQVLATDRLGKVEDSDVVRLRDTLEQFEHELLRQAGAAEARLRDRAAEASRPFMQRRGWSVAGAAFTVGGAVVGTLTLDISTIGAVTGYLCSIGGFGALLGQSISARRGSTSATALLVTARSIAAAEKRARSCRTAFEHECRRRSLR